MKNKLFFLGLLSIFGTSSAQEEYKPITEPIGLFADTQEHERHGTFTFIAGKMVDRITKVAARSPQIDFYNKYAIEDVLENYPLNKEAYFVHLGDLLDISCTTEWKRSFNIYQPFIKNEKLVLGLGNHDGFYVGNYAFDTHNGFGKEYIGPASWRDRCDTGFKKSSEHSDSYKTIMDKSKLILNFQKFLVQSGKTIFPITNSSYCYKDMVCSKANINDHWTSYFQVPKNVTLTSSGFGSSGVKDFWRSYMVNEVKLPMKNENITIKLIILDPSQSDKPEQSTKKTILNQLHLLSKSNILYGHIQSEQRKLIENIVNQPCMTNECFYVLSGHHPLKDYESKNYEWISNLIKNNSHILPLYLSAHTHKGYINSKNKINELNIGSFIENDPEFRTIQIYKKTNENKFIIETKKISIEKYFEKKCQITPKYYDSFKKSLSSNQYKNKISYLQQSFQVLINQIQSINDTKIINNTDAKNIWEQNSNIDKNKSLKNMIYDQMNKFSESHNHVNISLKCKNSIQAKYWDQNNYRDLPTYIKMLNEVSQNFQNNKEKNCSDDPKNEHYLAHADGQILGLTQDWLESQPSNIFPKNYKICNFYTAVKNNPQNIPASNENYKIEKTCINLSTNKSNTNICKLLD